MRDEMLEKKITEYIDSSYFQAAQNNYQLWEKKDSGRSQLAVSFAHQPHDVLCIAEYDNKSRCGFFTASHGMQKCVDHVILIKNQDGKWTGHLIEMKSKVDNGRWTSIKQKVRASILNIRALAATLDLPIEISDFSVYTTYERIDNRGAAPENPVERRATLGKPSFIADEWDQKRILVDFLKESNDVFSHTDIKMTRTNVDGLSTLCGELVI